MDSTTPKVVHRRQQQQQQDQAQQRPQEQPQPEPQQQPQQPQQQHHHGQPAARPVSLYDNLKDDNGPLLRGGASSVGNLNSVSVALSDRTRARTPSQANFLSTTVPQNMAQRGLASRHAPTRSSLRHSRMIVMTRQQGRVPRKYQPGVLQHRRLGTALAALIGLLGALVSSVAVWLLLWTPSLPARDNPVYSGPPLLLAGVVGLVLLGCCRKDYPGRPYSCCMFSFKVVSVSLAALASVAALCASAFALLHVVSLWGSACEPAKQVANATCTCVPAYKDPDRAWAIWMGTTRHEYPDLSCPEVESLLSVLLTGSGAANLLAGVLAGWYVLLHWRSRYTDVYAKVRTAPPPVVISNVSKIHCEHAGETGVSKA